MSAHTGFGQHMKVRLMIILQQASKTALYFKTSPVLYNYLLGNNNSSPSDLRLYYKHFMDAQCLS